MVHTCGNCGKTRERLRRCAKCTSEHYCSRDYQKAQWETHKKATEPTEIRHLRLPLSLLLLKNLAVSVAQPFTQLQERAWLHNRPEEDVYKLLIDAFRLHLDDYKFSRLNAGGSVFAGEPTSEPAFRVFLDRVESCEGFLPPWWSPEKRGACVRLGTEEPEGWSSLCFAPEKGDFNERYGDPMMVMQMRIFVEQVYGIGPGG
ncbi:Zinc finger MYND-type protein [Botryosphaeria dothidea]|uniref:Zinc finger MYND-type protein n=1 Tax=Botryosphaeria dothidea TaxID=55169 RepID=A0A8H4IWG8_9PEZI|nr:Zinc finger MYND-type protein [Botryosphaeria dothidea]